jgi:hypothetical protein
MHVFKQRILIQPVRSPLKWNDTGAGLAWSRDLSFRQADHSFLLALVHLATDRPSTSNLLNF